MRYNYTLVIFFVYALQGAAVTHIDGYRTLEDCRDAATIIEMDARKVRGAVAFTSCSQKIEVEK